MKLPLNHFLMLIFCLFFVASPLAAQSVEYPFPVSYLTFIIEQKSVKMAYMDVPAAKPNGQAVVLFHGKNFNGFYWKNVINLLNNEGYRVIVPDQIGWGKSDKPSIHYSFHAMASQNKALLDSLHLSQVIVIGHSMGGMLAVRFTLLFPSTVSKLILENTIGLEDYRTFVPYAPLEKMYQQELSATYESYKKYQQTYYPEWKPEYEELVKVQAEALKDPNFPQIAWANTLTSQMIYEQPVCYEFKNIKAKTLLIIGQADRTIVGKDRVPKEIVNQHGQYPQLGKDLQKAIIGSQLVELPGVGHIPHIQQFDNFKAAVTLFLRQ